METKLWNLSSIFHKIRRRSRAAMLPPRSALSDPPANICPETAKAALEQVNKRLDAELALKSSTETRALTLAGQCITLLSAIVAAVIVEAFGSGSHKAPIIAAGTAGGLFLFFAVLLAYDSAKPRSTNVLPGRLPDEIWDDLIEPGMEGPEFIARLMLGQQDAMVQNEINQDERARQLELAIYMVTAAVPAAILAALLFGILL